MDRRIERAWAGQCRLTELAKTAFIAALREGADLKEAAGAAGFCLQTFYRARDKDIAFARLWDETLAAAPLPRIIAPGNHRRLQRRKIRHLRFTPERQNIFLAHFAGTCNVAEAAAVAGVCEATIYRHRNKDPVFAAAFDQALAQGYVRLEAEALLQRLQAQQRLRDLPEPTGEVAAEFERVMKLLARWDRRRGEIGPRTVSHGQRQRVTIEEAAVKLYERLQHLDIPVLQLPPPDPADPE
jgi:hypothetical protein